MAKTSEATQPATWPEIAELFRHGRSDAIEAFIRSCPEFPMHDQAAHLAAMDMPAARSMALGMVGQGLAFGRATSLGAEVSRAAHQLLREDFERYGPTVVLPFTLSRAASEVLSALNLSGRSTEALAFADEILPWYGDEPENGATIRVARITALYQLNRIEEAKQAIAAERARGTGGGAGIELDRLDRLITQMTGKATQRKDQKPATEASEELAEENRRARALMDGLTSLLAGPGDEMNEWRAMQLIREGTGIFTHPTRGRDPVLLRDSLTKLARAREWARDNESPSHENDALWGLYLCHSRLDEPAPAAQALQALRANLEKARASVVNPIERGGITSLYPHLFPALCKMLVQTGQPAALLEAMEGAKGRAVADILVKRSGVSVNDRQWAEPAARLPDLMRRAGAHYLSFFVDDQETYAVLVAKDGSVHQADPIPIGRETIRAAAQRVDPRKWEDVPVDEQLMPLLGWLEPHRATGLLRDGDHMCYSADEHLHHIPLHVLRLDGKPLAEAFSISRTHGAAALAILLEARPQKLTKHVAVEVPTKQDLKRKNFVEALGHARSVLDSLTSAEKPLLHEQATVEVFKQVDLTRRIVHFATHGRFPEPGDPAPLDCPYAGSGLRLAGPNGLPDEEPIDVDTLLLELLTPARILDMNLVFTDSHVTLQSCVSGLAEEGLGGDALGLDWALMQAGARSLLASHWNVGLGLSAEYFDRFYDHWLKEGMSRARAWWSTVRDLRAAGGKLADPYCWAAFSLSGDWR